MLVITSFDRIFKFASTIGIRTTCTFFIVTALQQSRWSPNVRLAGPGVPVGPWNSTPKPGYKPMGNPWVYKPSNSCTRTRPGINTHPTHNPQHPTHTPPAGSNPGGYPGKPYPWQSLIRSMCSFLQNQIYRHKVLCVNYTTYDLHRARDALHPRTHADVVVLAHEDKSEQPHPYWYTRIIGIFHLNVCYEGRVWRMYVLWVRWLARSIDVTAQHA